MQHFRYLLDNLVQFYFYFHYISSDKAHLPSAVVNSMITFLIHFSHDSHRLVTIHQTWEFFYKEKDRYLGL